MDKCFSLYPNDEFKDSDGCIKPDGHDDAHVFRNEYGKLIKWEDDFNCTQKCDCWEEGGNCLIYREIEDNDL